MPNDVYSEITLHGVSLDMARPHLMDSEGEISFQVLLPLPAHLWPGSVGVAHEKTFPGTWLSAARDTWGTKCDAYGSPKAVGKGSDTVITLQTAWSTPRGWICALFNTLKCDITVEWLDEGQEDAHRETFKREADIFGGPEWKTETIPYGVEAHKRLHLALWGVEEFGEEE